MSIVIKSGIVEGAEANRFALNTAVANGIAMGLAEVSVPDSGQFSKTIAREFGQLRQAFALAIRIALADKIVHKGKTIVTWEEIKAATFAAIPTGKNAGKDYSQYHYRSRGFYVNPTTPNTFPMRVSRFKPLALAAVRKHILEQIRLVGQQSTSEFSVR